MADLPSFTMGIEEEYLLVDPTTRDLVRTAPETMLPRCQELLPDRVTPEFLQSQIEVGTPVCPSVADARAELTRLRGTVAAVAAEHGLAIIAASTHPFASWHGQTHTDKDRYNKLARDMQLVAQRLLICGMHVHLGIEEEELRIDLLNQVPYFLPHLLALSTSSPYWEGVDTGLKSYRLCVFDELPRTGLPEQFASYSHFQHTVDVMVSAGLIEDATKLWWDLRPSARFPTLEMRITDICTRLDDAIAIAALYRCLCRMLARLRRQNQGWRTYSRFLVSENRWRAQRYGYEEGLVDFGRGRLVPYAELFEELLGLLAEDAEAFACAHEIEHARRILAEGTSADWQRAAYATALAAGAEPEEAMRAVVDLLIRETLTGIEDAAAPRDGQAGHAA